MLTGSWIINTFKDNPFETGFFLPPAPEGMQTMPPARLGGGYFVDAATERPEEAEAFLAFHFDPANAIHSVEGMPVIPSRGLEGTVADLSPSSARWPRCWAETIWGFNVDVLMPKAFNTTMFDGFQAARSSERTAAEQAVALQASVAQ